MTTERTDVVVCGAGMAGLVAAVRAGQAGADVLLLEKGPRAGGSMYLSGGAVWTYDSVESIREADPGGDPFLQELLVDSLDAGLAWLEDLGARLSGMDYDLPGHGRAIEPAAFTQSMVDHVERLGGELRLETPMLDLVTEAGRVAGVVAGGDRAEIRADAVVLATGGFQGNEELIERYITDATRNLSLRANPWSTGDGLLAARDVGAKTTAGFGQFNGHNLAAPPAEFSNLEFAEASQFYGPMTVAVDGEGRRFTDESASRIDKTLAADTARLADGRAYYLFDRDVYESESFHGPAGVKVDLVEEFGGRVAERDTLGGIGEVLVEWGANGARAVETVERFNDLVRAGRAGELDPPRRRNREPVDTPPFYAVAVQPGITTTAGGLAVDGRMRVLRRAASSSDLDDRYVPEGTRSLFREPVGGLYAAGTDVGNVSHRGFVGGLSAALVTGRIAGAAAADRAAD